MKVVKIIALILTVVGGLNWGLVGVGSFMETNLNLVNLALGSIPTLEYVVYLLVGVSALLVAFTAKNCSCCK
jgi:uncharacterized membrane protein YuzA (DUF378 family)